MFRFESPYFFLLLLIIPIIVIFKKRKNTNPVLCMSSLTALNGIKQSVYLKINWIIPLLKYLALFLFIVALARPQWGIKHINISTEGINIILAVDLSESMAALDFKTKGKIVNRLQAAKDVIQNFISKRHEDRIGVVVFGSHAYTQLPLTRDYNTISNIIERLKIGSAGPNTAIGDAIGISIKRLEDIKSKSNIIILLTDGRSNSGGISPEIAADLAKNKNIKIYTIGIGKKGEAPFLINDPVFGQRYIYQKVNLDKKTLKDIANKTDGMYFAAVNTNKLAKIYNTINKLEKTKVKVRTFAQYKEYYFYFLVIGFVIFLIWLILINTRYLRIP